MKDWSARIIALEIEHPGPRRLVAGTLAALALVVLIGLLDYATGSEIILAILYLVPIALSTLYINRAAGLLVAAASAGAWISSDILLFADHLQGVAAHDLRSPCHHQREERLHAPAHRRRPRRLAHRGRGSTFWYTLPLTGAGTE